MERKWRILLISTFLVLLAAVIFLLKKYNEDKYISDLIAETDAEILDWDPIGGMLSLKFSLGQTVTKSKAKVEFPGTAVRLSYYSPVNCSSVLYENVEGADDPKWTTAFKPGDVVKVSARKHRLSKGEIPDEFILSSVSNETPPKCEN